jgi:lysophospholipase L1-like esterase
VRTRLAVLFTALAATACLAASAPGVAVAAPAKAKPKVKVLVLGDSVGQGLALKGLQKDKRIETVNAASVNCTLADGANSLESYKDGTVIGSGCPDWRTAWPPIVQQTQPDVVLVVTGGWEIVDRWFDNPPGVGLPSTIQDPAFQQSIANTHKEAASLLSATGAKVAFTNMQYINPPEALPAPPGVNGIQEIWWEPYGPTPPPNWAPPRPGQQFIASKVKTDALNKVLADLGSQGAIKVYDLNRFADPKGEFTNTLKGKPDRDADQSHFNDYGYTQVTKWLVPQLQKLAQQK